MTEKRILSENDNDRHDKRTTPQVTHGTSLQFLTSDQLRSSTFVGVSERLESIAGLERLVSSWLQ